MAITANIVDGIVQNQKQTSTTQNNNNLGGKMGYDQFLTLLCAEMQYQDPLEPTSNTDYVAQMATFSQLEATLSMKDNMEVQAGAAEASVANSLVGKNVIVVDPTSKTGYSDGIVDYVMYKDGDVYLAIGDDLFSISALDTVANDKYYEAVVQARTINNMIKDLPELGSIDSSYKTAVQQIRDLYDGLDSYQQGFVGKDDLEMLKRYESKMEDLVKAEEKAEAEEESETEEELEATEE